MATTQTLDNRYYVVRMKREKSSTDSAFGVAITKTAFLYFSILKKATIEKSFENRKTKNGVHSVRGNGNVHYVNKAICFDDFISGFSVCSRVLSFGK